MCVASISSANFRKPDQHEFVNRDRHYRYHQVSFADEKGFSVSKATWWCERNVGKTGNGSWSGFKDHYC